MKDVYKSRNIWHDLLPDKSFKEEICRWNMVYVDERGRRHLGYQPNSLGLKCELEKILNQHPYGLLSDRASKLSSRLCKNARDNAEHYKTYNDRVTSLDNP